MIEMSPPRRRTIETWRPAICCRQPGDATRAPRRRGEDGA